MSKANAPLCFACERAGKPFNHYPMTAGKIICPIVLASTCTNCGKKGHTLKYCHKPTMTTPAPAPTPKQPAPAPTKKIVIKQPIVDIQPRNLFATFQAIEQTEKKQKKQKQEQKQEEKQEEKQQKQQQFPQLPQLHCSKQQPDLPNSYKKPVTPLDYRKLLEKPFVFYSIQRSRLWADDDLEEPPFHRKSK
jgi:outer membrane biosynthesis protein TonB